MQRLREWLNDTKNWWATAAIGFSVYSLLQATLLGRWTIAGWPRPTVLAAVAGLVFGVGVVSKKSWARWFGIPWIAFMGMVVVINAAINGWSTSQVVSVVLIGVMAIYLYSLFFKNTEFAEQAGPDKPFLSLVLLLREPRYLDSTILASLASRAWNIEVGGTPTSETSEEEGTNDADSSNSAFIVGDSPLFMAKHPSAMCVIHNFSQPYFDEPEEVAEGVVEMRARHAISQHQAWIAVDVLHWFEEDEAPLEHAYRLIARMLAELADENVLAVVDPDASMIFAYDPETEEKLRSDNPLSALRKGYYVPVIAIAPDDPEMLAAVAKARDRWPEFVAAFEARKPKAKDHYSVKARFGSDENAEFMWMEVTGIENEVIYGLLGNDPANIPELHAGDRVRTTVAELNDWMVVVDGEPRGGFTVEVVQKRASEPPP